MTSVKKYTGKYRGIVVNNADPEQKQRLQLKIPDVTGAAVSTWVQSANSNPRCFFVPSKRSCVWVEFEDGDSDYPIWTGVIQDDSNDNQPKVIKDVPPGVSAVAFETEGGSSVLIRDQEGSKDGEIVLKAGKSEIKINDQGIFITSDSAKITLEGPKVSINGEALTIE